MKYYLYIPLLLMVLFSSCKMGRDFEAPQFETTSKYRFSNEELESAVNLKWWDLFKDPTLDSLIRIALANNQDIRMAAVRIEAAKTNIGYTKADQLPSFTYGAGVNGSGLSGNNQSSFHIYPELSWEVGFWGKYRRLNEAAQADYLSSQYAAQTVELGLISALVSTYYNILANTDLLQIATSTLESRDNGLVIMRDKYEGGLISKMDYNQAQIQRDVAATVVPRYKRLIAVNETALSLLLGSQPMEITQGIAFHEHQYELDIPTGIPSELLTRRPDIQTSQAILHSKTAKIGVAEALRWPSFNITGMLGAASSDLTDFTSMGVTWSAGGNLFGPLFQFGKNKDRVTLAEKEAELAYLQYEQTVIGAFKEVEDALIKIDTYKEELIAQESRTETSVESEELSHIRYDEGSTTYLEVLEQQRQAFSAQLDLLSNRLNLINSYILLYKALGGGWQVDTNNQ
ncbi:efflux transporter outer membrane subunit [Carboxylicivirga sp. M1479]|uniref:efflux transporter outer membrane subunit n=1 Tax=Carboxylicivirga sp. M1479 TaxID=2594476 RepID=UPI001177697D|nr:efflux transporter outer membrane subunit [Carboxylicivirga sp. M1479]TRX62381.1 efflux transporter outer membrane subunit [Carboxylicivirga sp. M1479]